MVNVSRSTHRYEGKWIDYSLTHYFRAIALIIVGAGGTDLACLANRIYSLVISNEGKTSMAFVNARASAC